MHAGVGREERESKEEGERKKEKRKEMRKGWRERREGGRRDPHVCVTPSHFLAQY